MSYKCKCLVPLKLGGRGLSSVNPENILQSSCNVRQEDGYLIIAHKIPTPEEPFVRVRHNEMCVCYFGGALCNTVPPGPYKIVEGLSNNITLYFILSGIIEIFFGVSYKAGVKTKDNLNVGFNGEIAISIINKERFIRTFFTEDSVYVTENDLRERLRKRIITVASDEFKSFTKEKILSLKRRDFERLFKSGLSKDLSIWGLTLHSITINPNIIFHQ